MSDGPVPRVVSRFPRAVREIENEWIALADGCRLAARIWLPEDALERPVPAILEYIPYRKRDGTAERDALNHPYVAGHGYACVRVDMRGNGESDGLMHDEYLPQEQDDALEVIAWLAGQPWCDGAVGMIGKSWGGFNALQVAARRPPALRAIVSVCSTDDRYADDIHYKGGALLMENLGWAATMFAYSSRPPDPLLVGESWRARWLERLDDTPLLVDEWLRHPHRDAYWRHGSICEDYAAIEAAVLLFGGWNDAYHNAVPRMLAGLRAPRRGIVGPWVHQYPNTAVPGPAIGFLQECLRWWDQWLKGEERGVEDDPLYRAYMMDSARPRAAYAQRDGRWVFEQEWPSASMEQARLYPGADGRLTDAPGPGGELALRSPLATGVAGGEYCQIWLGPEGPTDQRVDDAGSLVFDTEPLAARVEMLGAPEVWLGISADRPVAQVAVRLCDVWPDGASTRITYGVLNLAHRDGHATPAPLEPGRRYRVRVRLDDVAYAVAPGHRLRLAVSSAYWPLLWPAPEPVTLRVATADCELDLPVRAPRDDAPPAFGPPETGPPAAVESLRPRRSRRTVERDAATGVTRVCIVDDFGATRFLDHGLVADSICRETYCIGEDDPGTCRADIHWTQRLARGGWQVRTETRTAMWSDASHFHLEARLEAYEGDWRVFDRTWRRRIERQLV